MASPTHSSATTIEFPSEETPKNTHLAYELLTLFSAMMIGIMSVIFYWGTTQNAPADRRVGSISNNFWQNFFVAKVSIDYLVQLLKEKKWIPFILMPLLAGGAYAPQIIIAIQNSQSSAASKSFNGISTFLSGAVMYAYSLIELFAFYQKIKNHLLHKTHTDRIEIHNLEITLQRLRFSNPQTDSTRSCVPFINTTRFDSFGGTQIVITRSSGRKNDRPG
ncbi:MAG: hypothetical protein A3F13_01380 [Gammaproteobacteria bacterium RIFCSPHIGHO2_12_FULL_40_19]|nr:MAG: hypothetical protein A3F13_01380 [Gammaproteobacteria bacterium RIFCSPHIGHO2_12_FULL_40_19]